jgi:RNA polymerase-binding transcription factor DksA
MASVQEKGMPFNSDAVMLSSNTPIWNKHLGITCQDAFVRRFVPIRAVLKPEWKTSAGTLDQEKLNALTPAEKAKSPHLYFERFEQRSKPGTSKMEVVKTSDDRLSLAELTIILKASLVNIGMVHEEQIRSHSAFTKVELESQMDRSTSRSRRTAKRAADRGKRVGPKVKITDADPASQSSQEDDVVELLVSSESEDMHENALKDIDESGYGTCRSSDEIPITEEESTWQEVEENASSKWRFNPSLRQAYEFLARNPFSKSTKIDEEEVRTHRVRQFMADAKAKFYESKAKCNFNLKHMAMAMGLITTAIAAGVVAAKLFSNQSHKDDDYESDDDAPSFFSQSFHKDRPRGQQRRKRGNRNRTHEPKYSAGDDRYFNTSFENGRIVHHEAQIARAVGDYQPTPHEQEQIKQRAMYTAIYDNAVSLQCDAGNLYGFFIKGNILVTNLHFFRKPIANGKGFGFFEENDTFNIRIGSVVYTETFNKANLFFSKEGELFDDVAAYKVSPKVPLRPSILKYFATLGDVEKTTHLREAYFLRPNAEVESRLSRLSNVQHVLEREDWSSFGKAYANDTYVSQYLSYDARSKGDCGSLVIQPCDGPRKILGMHIAGRRDNGVVSGMGALLWREKMQAMIASLETRPGVHSHCQRQFEDFPFEYDPDCRFPSFEGDFVPIGKIKGSAGGIASKSKLTDSVLRDADFLTESPYEPAVLGGSDPRSNGHSAIEIIFKGVSKGGKPIVDFPQAHVDAAVANVVDVMEMHPTTCPARPLSLEECINGSEDYPCISPLPMNTSEGFPYNLSRPFGEKGKRWAFSEITLEKPVRVITHQPILDDYNEYDAMVREGIRAPFVFSYVLKDEMRHIDKIHALSTRVICCAPVTMTLLLKKYFGAYVNHFQSSYSNTFSCVGMNVFSKDWNDMVAKMRAISSYGFDGDFKKYERLLSAQLAVASLDVTEAWYRKHGKPTPEEAIARHTLMMGIIHTICKVGPYVFWKAFNNPSGNYLTTLLNTIVNAILSRLAWIKLSSESGHPELSSLTVFCKLVAENYFGDDNLFTVSHHAAPWFNSLTLGTFYARHNIEYTPGCKTDALSADMKHIFQLSFLKMTTRVHPIPIVPGIKYYGVVETESILKSLLCVNKDLDPMNATEMNCDDALRRSFTRGESYFNAFRSLITDEMRARGSGHHFIDFVGCYNLWIEGKLDVTGTYVGLENSVIDDMCYKPPTILNAMQDWAVSKSIIFSHMDRDPVVEDVAPVTLQDEVESIEVAPETTGLAPMNKKIMNSSVRDLIKRYAPLCTTAYLRLAEATPIGQVYMPTARNIGNFMACGNLSWFSALYRVYKGSTRFQIMGKDNIEITFTNPTYETGPGYAGALLEGKLHVAGAAPFARGEKDVGLIGIQTPYISQYQMLKLPKTVRDLEYPSRMQYSPGAITALFTDEGSADPNGRVWASGGDDMRFAYLYMVPTIQVKDSVTSFAPHPGPDYYEVAETIRFDHDLASPLFMFNQAILATLPLIGTPQTEDVVVSSISIASSHLSNADLNVIGIPIGINQPRETQPGVDYVVKTNFSNTRTGLASGAILKAGDETGADALAIADVNPLGRQEIIPFGPEIYTVSDTVNLPKSNYINANFKSLMGYNPGLLYAPIVEGSKDVFVATTRVATLEGDINVWDTTSQNAIFSQMNRTTDSKVGVSFTDSSATAPTTGGRGFDLPPVIENSDMDEKLIDFSMIVDRYQWVQNLDWSTSDARGSVLASMRLPWDLLTSATNQAAFSQFVYWKGTVRLKFQLQSTMFQQGCLIAYFVPLTEMDEINKHVVGSRTSQTVCPHVILTAGASRNATIDIPFVHLLKRLDLGNSETEALGTLVVQVFNPLETGPTATGTALSSKLSVFGSFPSSDFQVIDPTAGSKREVFSQGAVSTKVSNVTNNIDGVYDSTIDFANKTNDNMEGGSQKTDVSGLDKPNMGVNAMQVVRLKYPNLANACNIDQNQVLSLYADRQSLFLQKEIGTDVDEMSFEHLRSTRSFLETVTWSNSDPDGTMLYSNEMTPCPGVIRARANSVYQPTLLEYVTLPFSLWKGSLKIMIQIVGSKVHTGRIAICTHYARTAKSVPFEQAMSQYAHIFDFSAETNTHEVTLDWRSAYEMLRVPNGGYDDLTPFSMGEWSLRVINPLQTMDSVSSSVEINVFMSAGDDFVADFVGSNAIDLVPVVNSDESQLVPFEP